MPTLIRMSPARMRALRFAAGGGGDASEEWYQPRGPLGPGEPILTGATWEWRQAPRTGGLPIAILMWGKPSRALPPSDELQRSTYVLALVLDEERDPSSETMT